MRWSGNPRIKISWRFKIAVSGKYGQVNIPKIGLGEPVFILRAQDKLAVAALGMYRALVRIHGFPLGC